MNETAPVQSQGFYAEEMTISVGPQHPSTHGVLRFVVKTDGEVHAKGGKVRTETRCRCVPQFGGVRLAWA